MSKVALSPRIGLETTNVKLSVRPRIIIGHDY